MTMEYAEAINDEAAELAFAIALQLRAEGAGNLSEIATRAVASAYCVCVTDGEDAAEHRFSLIHQQLIKDLERRLSAAGGESEAR